MSTLTYDFHSICVNYHGIDCDFDHRCEECADIADDVMTDYVKQRYKSKSKDPLLSASSVDGLVIVSNPPSSVELLPGSLDPPSVSEDIQSKVNAKLSIVKNEMTNQFRSFFDELARVEVKFSSINQKLSQVISSSSHDVVEQNVFTSQDVTNRSLSAPPLVAVRFEHRLPLT